MWYVDGGDGEIPYLVIDVSSELISTTFLDLHDAAVFLLSLDTINSLLKEGLIYFS